MSEEEQRATCRVGGGSEVTLAWLYVDYVDHLEYLGWRRFPGELLVKQSQATVPFTFNLPMTTPIHLRESLTGTIDLLGPPW